MIRSIFALICACAALEAGVATAQLAFPGAVGYGAGARGGRGGTLYEVTTLEDTGDAGSLRHALEASGPRIVVFRVGGTIVLDEHLQINEPNITIAGQTAPGDGILIRNGSLIIRTAEVIVRGLRVRLGRDADPGTNMDGVAIVGNSAGPIENVVVDHCSISWTTDGGLDVNARSGVVRDVTLQHNILSEMLEPHALGLLLNGKADHDQSPERITIYGNFMSNFVGRFPLMGTNVVAEVVNNVGFNWGSRAIEANSQVQTHVIGNCLYAGEDSNAGNAIRISTGDEGLDPARAYLADNICPALADPSDPPEVCVDFRPADDGTLEGAPFLPASGTVAGPAVTACPITVDEAGAIPPDLVDQRVRADFEARTSRRVADEDEVGGYPPFEGGPAPMDSDHDGMPDDWETEHGHDPSDASDGPADADGDGYTNVEEYLNSFFSSGDDPEPGADAGPTSDAGSTDGGANTDGGTTSDGGVTRDGSAPRGDAGMEPSDEGCGCSTTSSGGGPLWMVALALIAIRRRT